MGNGSAYNMRNILNEYFLCTNEKKVDTLHYLITKKEIKFMFEIFQKSDFGEKKILLKSINDIRSDEDKKLFINIFTDAIRTNSAELFKFIAYQTDFPASFFSEKQFNQFVLKALFLDLSLENIKGIRPRNNDRLKQMILDYEEERILANRSIPKGISYYKELGDFQ